MFNSHYDINVRSGNIGSQGAARAENKARSVERDVKGLRADLARTLMICEALWELLSENEGLSVPDLHKKLYEIDMRDGVLDGKNQRKAKKCPACQHMVSTRHPACIYCGKVMDESLFTI
jgi:hypothetical protein